MSSSFISSYSSVQSLSHVTLRPHELQHARPPCPSPTPRVHSNSRPSSQWCHPAISSSAVPFSSCPESLPPSESLPMSQLFAWGGQRTGVSALASFLSKNTGLISFRMDWLDLLAVQGTLKSLLQHHSSKASVLWRSAFFTVQLSHPYMTTGKTIALTRQTFVGKVISLLFNMLSRLLMTFLPRSKRLLIPCAWLQHYFFHILPHPKNLMASNNFSSVKGSWICSLSTGTNPLAWEFTPAEASQPGPQDIKQERWKKSFPKCVTQGTRVRTGTHPHFYPSVPHSYSLRLWRQWPRIAII